MTTRNVQVYAFGMATAARRILFQSRIDEWLDRGLKKLAADKKLAVAAYGRMVLAEHVKANLGKKPAKKGQ